MAALSPVSSVEALLAAVQKSGLLSAAELEKVNEEASKTTDPKELARNLIKQRLLTKWQAAQLLHSYHSLHLGKYELLDQLNAGDLGRVYLVEHVQMKRRHLLRVLAKRHMSNPEVVKRFLSEAQQACGLDHRNISHIYDVNHDGDYCYVVMEYIEGTSLDQLIEQEGPLSLAESLEFVRQTSEGLAHAHSHGLIHGQLNPANLLLDDTGTVKILDIGQSQLSQVGASSGAEKTPQTRKFPPHIFQPPEERAGTGPADQRSDIYSIGSIFSYLLTGQAAADAADASRQLAQIAGLPSDAVQFCTRLMAEQPAERPATMPAVLQQLGQLEQAVSALSASATAISEETQVAVTSGQQPSAKPKKLPAARPLSELGALPVARPLDNDAAKTGLPVGGIVIDPSGGGRKTTKAPVSSKAAAPAPRSAMAETKPKRAVPWALVGAIGGGIVALGLLIAIGMWLFSGRKGTTSQTVAPTATQPQSTTPGEEEANPEGSVEANPAAPAPEAIAVLPTVDDSHSRERSNAQQASASVPSGSAGVAPGALAASDAAKAKTPSETIPQVENAAVAPTKESEPKTAAKPEVAKTGPPPAKTDPAKKAAKPSPPANPFQGFAKAVALPDHPATPDQQTAPVELGPCRTDPMTVMTVELKGGETVARGGQPKIALQSGDGMPAEWHVYLEGDAPANIATLNVDKGKLWFQWTAAAAGNSATARLVANCVLELNAGSARHAVALRRPIVGAPLSLEIERPGAGAKWVIPDMPDLKRVRIELLRPEGIKHVRAEPDQPIPAGEELTAWIGPDEKSLHLGVKLSTSANARGVNVSFLPQIKLEGMAKAQPYRKRDFATSVQQAALDVTALNNQLSQLSTQKPSSSEKARVDMFKADLTAKLDRSQTLLTQLHALSEFVAAVQGTARLHFRVFYQADDAEVDLLTTTEDPKLLASPSANPAPPAKAPATGDAKTQK